MENKNKNVEVSQQPQNDILSKNNNGVCEYKSIGCKHNNCIISCNEKAIIKKLVGNKDLDIIREDGKRIGEFKLFVVENISGKVKCSNFLDKLWKQTGHGKATFDASFEDVSVVLCYLSNPIMEKLRKKFLEELPMDSLIISCNFYIPDWEPKTALEVKGLWGSEIFVYQKSEGIN